MIAVVQFISENAEEIALVASLLGNAIKFTKLLEKIQNFSSWGYHSLCTFIKHKRFEKSKRIWGNRKFELNEIGISNLSYNSLQYLAQELIDKLYKPGISNIRSVNQLGDFFINDFETDKGQDAIKLLDDCYLIIKDAELKLVFNEVDKKIRDVLRRDPGSNAETKDFEDFKNEIHDPLFALSDLIRTYQIEIKREETKFGMTI